MRTAHPSRPDAIQPSNWRIDQLPGLSAENQAQLLAYGITTTLQLLQRAGTPAKRQILATQLQIHLQHVNKWVALADLSRIPSVGCQYCGLLLHAGIGSCTQLVQTPLHRLHQQVLKLQVATFQRRDLCPSVDEVAVWVQQARSLCLK
jgi:hypothetical protein